VTSLDRETGRDRYFAAKERELDELLDPGTGLLSERWSHLVPCLLCGGEEHRALFVKRGYPIVRCAGCDLVFSNPQVDESRVLDEYRAGGSSDLWVDVLTSPRQLELDRAKFERILDELEPHRGQGRLLDVGTSIGLFLHLAQERGWSTVGTEFGGKARAYARERFGLDVLDAPLDQIGGEFDVVTLNSVLEHVNDPRAMLRQMGERLAPGGALYLIVPNVDSLACRVLHERAATFDGRNHLVYFGPRTLRAMLEGEGFRVVEHRTSVSSLDPVLEWLSYREPYGEQDPGEDGLVAWADGHRGEIERLLERLDLGYKLHALAVRTA
jgi:SAM-dependent methyltransferase